MGLDVYLSLHILHKLLNFEDFFFLFEQHVIFRAHMFEREIWRGQTFEGRNRYLCLKHSSRRHYHILISNWPGEID